MPGKKTFSDSDNEGSSLADSEIELQKLQRQYKLLENERKTLYHEAQETMKKQKLEIETLEKERKELDLTMQSLKSSTQQRKQKKHFEELKSLSTKNSELQKAIEKEKQKQEELDIKIQEETKKLAKAEETRQASKEDVKRSLSDQKRIEKLEDQLQLANMKFCKFLKDNKDLRKEIDSLRIQRQKFDELLGRIQREKNSLGTEIAEVMKKSTMAHEERNEAHEKLTQLREKSERDGSRFDADMKQLKRNIDDSKKLLDFLATVGKDREEDEEMRRLRERKEALMLEKRLAFQVDSLGTYEDAWSRIRMATQEEEVDAIISKFLEVEEENFAMFNFINNQSTTVEQLQEEINAIKKKISSFEEDHERKKHQKSLMQKNFEDKQVELSELTSAYEEKNEKILQLLKRIRDRISSILETAKCEGSEFNSDLGFDERVTDGNCLKCLALIEEKIDTMILERSVEGHKSQEEHDEELLPAANQIPTFRGERDFLHNNDEPISIALPSMREKVIASVQVPSPTGVDPEKAVGPDEDLSIPPALAEIRHGMLTTVLEKERSGRGTGDRLRLSSTSSKR